MWVIYDGNKYWNKTDHAWEVGIENATKYSDEDRKAQPYPKLSSSESDCITWEEI